MARRSAAFAAAAKQPRPEGRPARPAAAAVSRIFTTTVTPNHDCKVLLPPCSALEIKNAALEASASAPAERCVLECDLATHSFVLCSLTPEGPRQASLGTVITNDPAEAAWLFLKVRGPHSFHVVGRLIAERRSGVELNAADDADDADVADEAGAGAAEGELNLDDSGWGLGAPVRTSSSTKPSGGDLAEPVLVDEEADIDVLLPEGHQQVEYPSDADSEDFVRWMQSRAHKPSPPSAAASANASGGQRSGHAAAGRAQAKEKPGAKKLGGRAGADASASSVDDAANGAAAAGASAARHGGGRSARRRAAQRRSVRLGLGAEGDGDGGGHADDAEWPPPKQRKVVWSKQHATQKPPKRPNKRTTFI